MWYVAGRQPLKAAKEQLPHASGTNSLQAAGMFVTHFLSLSFGGGMVDQNIKSRK